MTGRQPFIESVPTETLKVIDTEARETHNMEALTLVSGELARRAMLSEVAYDANDDTPQTIEREEQRWV